MPDIPGTRKAAILLVLMGTERAANVLKHLDEDQIELLTLEIANLGKVSDEEKREVMEEFKNLMKAREFIVTGGVDYARQLLEKALGPEKAMEIIDKLVSSLQVRPFEFLRRVDAIQLVNFLQSEHPQTIALVLSYMPPQQAATVLASLPEELRPEVVKRIAMLDRATPETVKEVERLMEQKLSTFAAQPFSQVGGIETVAEIINTLDRSTEKTIMDSLSETDPELAEEIRRKMFVFEDIVKLDDRSVQLVLREVDTKDLALALKGATDEVKEKIFNNMSKRARALLQEEIEFMGPVRVRDVEEAQQKIIAVIRRLEEAGEIVIARGGGEEMII
ncbi:MAG: flagellar motor switch protein FliG [Thermotogae bacterium]|nr:flagellar motor switch protein FliG [Thermotogota bacterium]